MSLSVISDHKGVKDVYDISSREGEILLDVICEAELPGINVFGVCDKKLACHSCAVHIKDKNNKLPPPSTEEMDVLVELGDIFRENETRMSCQICLRKELEGLQVEVPRSAFYFLQQEEEKF